MIELDDSTGPRDERDSGSDDKLGAWKLILIAEVCALLIGLLVPITRSKVGRPVRFARYFFDDAGYLHEVLVVFILTNLVIAVVGLAALLHIRRYKRRHGHE